MSLSNWKEDHTTQGEMIMGTFPVPFDHAETLDIDDQRFTEQEEQLLNGVDVESRKDA